MHIHLYRVSALALVTALAATGASAGVPAPSPVLPSGASNPVNASISTNGATMTITQSSNAAAVINWSDFSIGQNASVNVQQPSATALLINRVNGTTQSQIDGSLSANGRVFLINPNGISIGTTGYVQAAGGFLASTLDASGTDDKFTLSSNRDAAPITMTGAIASQGFVILAGGSISLPARYAEVIHSINAKYVGMVTVNGAQIQLPNDTNKFAITAPAANGKGKITPFSTPGTINIEGAINVNGGALILNAGNLPSAAINIDAPITITESDVSIQVGSGQDLAGLRIGNAQVATRYYGTAGSITFEGDHSRNSLSINGAAYTLVWNVDDFRAINKNRSGKYALAQSINFWPDDVEIAPRFRDYVINSFNGILNGLGNNIYNLKINAFGKNVGPFLSLGSKSRISNLYLTSDFFAPNEQVPVTTQSLGGLAAIQAYGSQIRNVHVDTTANFTQSGGSFGGLVGSGSGLISKSSVDVEYAFTNASNNPFYLGGFVGLLGSTGQISESWYTGSLDGKAPLSAIYVGGLAGWADGNIEKSVARSSVSGSGLNAYVGGLVGSLSASGSIISSKSLTRLSGGDQSSVGGLAGISAGVIDGSYFGYTDADRRKASVKGGTQSIVGGLVGTLTDGASLTNSQVSGVGTFVVKLSAGNGSTVGGLVGLATSTPTGQARLAASKTAKPSNAAASDTAIPSPRLSGLTSDAEISVGADTIVGGAVGRMTSGTLENVTPTKKIKAGVGSTVQDIIGKDQRTSTTAR